MSAIITKYEYEDVLKSVGLVGFEVTEFCEGYRFVAVRVTGYENKLKTFKKAIVAIDNAKSCIIWVRYFLNSREYYRCVSGGVKIIKKYRQPRKKKKYANK